MAKNKPTSEMGSRKLANIINDELKEKKVTDNKDKILLVTKSTINNYLKKRHLKVRKIKKNIFIDKKTEKAKG
jgi:hypothetical protein